MPYTSERQRRFFHTETARAKGITPEMVAEYDAATKGRTLPKTAQLHESFLREQAAGWHYQFLKYAAVMGIKLPQAPRAPQVARVGALPGLQQTGNLGNKVKELAATHSFSSANKAFSERRTLPTGG